MKTPNNAATDFLATLTGELNYQHYTKENTHGDIILQRLNAEGHAELRIRVNYEGERQPHSLQVIKLDGRRSRVVEWESTLSAYMPSEAVLAMLKAA